MRLSNTEGRVEFFKSLLSGLECFPLDSTDIIGRLRWLEKRVAWKNGKNSVDDVGVVGKYLP